MVDVVLRSYESAAPLVLLTYSLKALVTVAVGEAVTEFVVIAVTVPAPKPVVAALPAVAVPAGVLSERAVPAVKSTVLLVIAVRVSVAVAVLVGSNFDVAVFVTAYGPPVALVGRVTFSRTVKLAPAATGPVSGVPFPLLSRSVVVPSLWYRANVVPAGKLLPVTPTTGYVISKLSVPVPLFVMTLLKLIVAPCAPEATVWPVADTVA